MEKSKNRARTSIDLKIPECSQQKPDTSQNKEILKELLEIEKKRLKIAVKIEEERKIVFPETTIIIRDILKLQNALSENKQPENLGIKKEFRNFKGEKC